jgi:tetratricopeptide (TPR) repeat protein
MTKRSIVCLAAELLALLAAGCFSANGVLPEQFSAPSAEKPPLINATVALVPAADAEIRDDFCPTGGTTCTLSVEPALSKAVAAVLRSHFAYVKSSATAEAASHDGDLVAVEAVETTAPKGPVDGAIKVTVSFKDSATGSDVSEVSSSGKLQVGDVWANGPHSYLILVDTLTLVLFIPIHMSIANQDGLEALQKASSESLASIVNDLNRQLSSDARLASYVPLRKRLVEAEGAEQEGESAESKGRLPEALSDYLSAIKALPPGQAVEIEYQLRERIVHLVARMNPPPELPEEYRREMTIGLTAVKEARNPGDYRQALDHFVAAADAAPWEPQPYYNLGLVWKELGDNAAAVRYYELCLLAEPDGPDAPKARQQIAGLRAKSGASEASVPATGQ